MRSQTIRDRQPELSRGGERPQRSTRQGLMALYAGLTLNVLALLALTYDLVVHGGLDRHLHEVYEGYVAPPDAGGIATYLYVLGGVGIAGWLWTARAVRRQQRAAGPVASVLLALGVLVAVAHLTVREYGQTILPPVVGMAGLLLCVPGLAAVVLLWRGRARGSRR